MTTFQHGGDSDGTWFPASETAPETNVGRLMSTHGIDDIDGLRRRSIEDISWYWDAVVADLGIPFFQRYECVVDDPAAGFRARWFIGGGLNVASACVGRWSDNPRVANTLAVVAEAEDGELRTLTYAELADEVDALACALNDDGFDRGDAIAVFMPTAPEAAIAAYAIAKLGAVWVPLPPDLAADEIAARLSYVAARAVICTEGTWRRGRRVAIKPVLDEALEHVPTVRRVVVAERLGLPTSMVAGRDVAWAAYTADSGRRFAAAETVAAHPLLVAYAPRAARRPQAMVHVHGGLLVKVASEAAYQTDLRPGDVALWMADPGSIAGPWTMLGAHANGATLMLYEGATDWPAADRLWALVERHRVSMLGLNPALAGALRRAEAASSSGHDTSSLRIIAASGAAWSRDAWDWLSEQTARRTPIITLSGGAAVGGSLLSPYPVEPIGPCALGGISLGMDVDVVAANGGSVRDEIGELVCRQAWPSMTRPLVGDSAPEPDGVVWCSQRSAIVASDRRWQLFRRDDDTIEIGGRRLRPADVEAIALEHPAVSEAACVGVPDVAGTEELWLFWVPVSPVVSGVADELADAVSAALGPRFRPNRVVGVSALPKTGWTGIAA